MSRLGGRRRLGHFKKEDQIYGQRLAEMAKKHSSEAFYALDDPLEAAARQLVMMLLFIGDGFGFVLVNCTIWMVRWRVDRIDLQRI
jgi:hypothetical protein